MPERLYNIVHEINTNNYQVSSNEIKYSVFYPNYNSNFTEIAGSDYFSLENIYDNINITVNMGTYILDSIFTINEKIYELNFQIELPNDVELEQISDQFISVNKGKNKLLTIISTSLVDDAGNNGPLPKISFDQDIISIVLDKDWVDDNSRVLPLVYTLSTSFSILPSMASMSVKALSVGGQVYQDVRPDSATQFYVVFYDDSEFKRPRPIYQGKPVCSTVPYAIGDTYNLTPADIEQWYDGVGDPSRDVYLQIIASKALPTEQNITYDVFLPGDINYLNQQAEFIDMMDGLPVYRGAFRIYENNPPAYLDGIGYLNVYLNETRYKALSSKASVLRIGKDILYSTLSFPPYNSKYGIKSLSSTIESSKSVAPFYGISSLLSTFLVYNNNSLSMLTSSINIIEKVRYGISALPGDLIVHELGRNALKSTIIASRTGTKYGLNMLSAKANISGMPIVPSVQKWYDSKNMEIYSDFTNNTQINNKYNYTSSDTLKVSKVSIGQDINSLIDQTGQVWCWGYSKYLCGINNSSSDEQVSPVEITDTQPFLSVKSGFDFTVARNSSDELWGWGHDNYEFSPTPGYPILLVSTKISQGYAFPLFSLGPCLISAQDNTGVVYQWGSGWGTDCPTVSPNLPIVATQFAGHTFDQIEDGSYFTVGLKSSGEVWFSGGYGYADPWLHLTTTAEKISGADIFTKIAVGPYHILALKSDGSVRGWGMKGYGELGFQNISSGGVSDWATYPTAVSVNSGLDIVDISASNNGSLFLSSDGKIYSSGWKGNVREYNLGADTQTGYYDTTSVSYVEVTGNKTWKYISNGLWPDYAIDDDDILWSWGEGFYNYQYLLSQGILGKNGKSSPGRVKFFNQDMWGGYDNQWQTILGDSIPIPNLPTIVSQSSLMTDINNLNSADVSYLTAAMNDEYKSTGFTNWAMYYYYANHGTSFDDYAYAPNLKMMLNADSEMWSNFKQAGAFPSPFYTMALDPSDGVFYNFVGNNGFIIEISHILRALQSTLSPFDSSYVLNNLSWYSSGITQNQVKIFVTFNDVVNGVVTVKTHNASAYLSGGQTTIPISLNDMNGGYGADILNQSYPTKVKILIIPSVKNYYINGLNQSIYGPIHFVSPQTSVEITDIKINPSKTTQI